MQSTAADNQDYCDNLISTRPEVLSTLTTHCLYAKYIMHTQGKADLQALQASELLIITLHADASPSINIGWLVWHNPPRAGRRIDLQ